MNDVQVIKANRNENRIRGRKVEILRVAAYCRVSTDSEDQLNSYKSQVMYYTDLIKKKQEWSLADIYADEAITGTQVTKREDFQRMINDCMNGDIDMVITKSISRFARNTLDTLKYVRMLKEKGIAVFFEDENINTLTMDGELLLVVLSSVAQQEVENISSNVKKGLKMKMQRGELVGFQGCLGYDYHKDTKSISVNEKEAEIVRYIFNRYIEGAGCTVIANELENLGYKTKYGSSRWVQSTVIGIIKNEKYKGDLLLGKTFTVDPISKRRLENFGEEDKFYIRDHHEAIISEEIFEEAQKILAKRNVNRGVHQEGQKRNKFSRKYAFSCMIKCGFCGGTLSRRNWHSSSAYTKTIWHCVTATKHGKKNCPHCKGIPEEVIENAFVKSYQLLCSDQHEVVSEFLQKVEDILKDDASLKRLPKIEKEMTDLQRRKEKLLDLRLDNNIDRDIYDKKNQELSEQLKKLQAEQLQLVELSKNQESTKTRIREFRKNLNSGELLESFDRVVFESVVERIIIGGYNDEGVEDPLKITFVYKTGIHSNLNAKDFKPKRKNAAAVHTDAELCSYASVEDNKLCLHSSSDTCGNGLFNEKEILNQRRKKQMKSTELLNTKVIHKMLGEGIITEAGDNYVTVKFASKVSRFIFPIAFEKFITAENSDIQEMIIEEINRARNEEHKKQAEREMVRQQERTRINAEKKASANKKSVARPKRISGKRMIFFVFQGYIFEREFNGGYIWAPISNKSGYISHQWEIMRDVREGDIILHGCDGYVKAISVAKTSCFKCMQPEELAVEGLWDSDGGMVKCDYTKIENPIKTADFKDDIIRFCQVKYSPFDKDGNGNTAYLFDINRELAKIFIRATVNKNNYLNSIDYINDFLNEE